MSWCLGYRRHAHVDETVRDRDGKALCDACELRRRREADR